MCPPLNQQSSGTSRGLQRRKCLFRRFTRQLHVHRMRTELNVFALTDGSFLGNPDIIPVPFIVSNLENALASKVGQVYVSFFTSRDRYPVGGADNDETLPRRVGKDAKTAVETLPPELSPIPAPAAVGGYPARRDLPSFQHIRIGGGPNGARRFERRVHAPPSCSS
jgi:hypothetical protein